MNIKPHPFLQSSRKVLPGSPGQIDFIAGYVTCEAYLPNWTSYLPTKSLTKMSKKWSQASKMCEWLAQRASWNSKFFSTMLLYGNLLIDSIFKAH